jgi:hypothetical protein
MKVEFVGLGNVGAKLAASLIGPGGEAPGRRLRRRLARPGFPDYLVDHEPGGDGAELVIANCRDIDRDW